MKLNREERQAHPGYAVQFEDGSWLSFAHGFHQSPDAFYADNYATEQEAKEDVEYAIKSGDIGELKYFIIPGWEPLCEKLRLDVSLLKAANTLDPDDVFEITMDLENIIAKLKGN